MPRSGTNYLWDLLCLHPHCGQARPPIREDFFLEASDHLLAYTSAVQNWWDPMWGSIDQDLVDSFHESIGDGLISFLWVERERRLITKSPSVRNVNRFFTFFPTTRLILLVRDGRSVVQSSMATFGWDFDRAARNWAEGAEEIRQFEANHQDRRDRYLLVRYEDLIDDLRGSLRRLFRFLELDEAAFDFDAAARLPVRGSSFYFGPGHTSVHWDPVEKENDFSPKERWRSWTPSMHARFEWIAGKQSRYFGYGVGSEPGRRPDVMRNRVRDWKWHTKEATRTALYRAKARLGTAARPLRERLGLKRAHR